VVKLKICNVVGLLAGFFAFGSVLLLSSSRGFAGIEPTGVAERVRLEIVKDAREDFTEIAFKTPSFYGLISPMPTLGLVSLRAYVNSDEYFEFRMAPGSFDESADDLGLPAEVSEKLSLLKSEFGTVVNAVRGGELQEVAPFLSVFEALVNGRGILSYTSEKRIIEVNRFRQTASLRSPETVEVSLLGKWLRLELDEAGGRDSLYFSSPSFGIVSFTMKRGEPRIAMKLAKTEENKSRSLEVIYSELESSLREIENALIICSSSNEKIERVHKLLVEKVANIEHGRKLGSVNIVTNGQAGDPPRESALKLVGSAPTGTDLQGYKFTVKRLSKLKRIYYFATSFVNGLILLDRWDGGGSLVVAATNKRFDPDPVSPEIIPTPEIYWKFTLPENRLVTKTTTFSGIPTEQSELPEEESHLLRTVREAFRLLLRSTDDDEILPPEVRVPLSLLVEGKAQSAPGETLKTLLSLRYRQVFGVVPQKIVTYQDPEYFYQLNLNRREDYVSYAFGYGDEMSPLLYRFFLAKSGDYAQLVASYPVQLSIGLANYQFLRSSRNLRRVKTLSTYFARYEPALTLASRIVDSIWARRELVKPKLFMRPLPGPPYTDWLDAETFP